MTRKRRRQGSGSGSSSRIAGSTGKTSGIFHRCARWLSEPPAIQPLTGVQAWPHLLSVFLGVLAVYVYTLPPNVVLEDDGEFVAAAYFAGVAHPPGYPLFVLLSHPFTWLPVGSVALRVHLASAVYGALACGVLWWALRKLGLRASAAYAGAFAFGFSGIFWSQAIVAEVYSLNALLFFSLFALCLGYLDSRRGILLVLISLIYGLSLSNHWPLILLATPALFFLLASGGRRFLQDLRTRWLPMALALAVGLSPYLWMVWRSQSHPELAHFGPLETWQDFWFYVSRQGYAQVDASPSAGWLDKAYFSAFMFQEIVRQFTPLGAVFVAIGLYSQWKRWKAAVAFGLTLSFLCGTIGLILLLDFDYEFTMRAIFKVYPIIPYGIMALWLALGVDGIAAIFRANKNKLANFLSPVLCVIVVVIVVFVNFSSNNRRRYDFAQYYGMTLLESFEAEATVFTTSDLDSIVLGYLHYVEGVRPDLKLFNTNGIAIASGKRLFQPLRLNSSQQVEFIRRYAATQEKPVYFLDEIPPGMSYIDFGFFKKIDGTQKNEITYATDEKLMALYRRAGVIPDDADAWIIRTRDFIIGHVAEVLTPIVTLHPDHPMAEKYRDDLSRATTNFTGILGQLLALDALQEPYPKQFNHLLDLGKRAVDPTINKREHSLLYYLEGRARTREGHFEAAIRALERSIAIYPHPENGAIGLLEQLSS